MKKLKVGAVNTISFVKQMSYVVNSFDVTFEKIVGTEVLTLSDLQDLNNLDSCKDFIRINLDLLSNSLEGGEYHLTLANGDASVTYLCEVETQVYANSTTSGIYADTVTLSTDLSYSTPDVQQPTVGYSFDVELSDGVQIFDSVYYVNPNDWIINARIKTIGVDVSTLRVIATDSDLNQISKDIVVTDHLFEEFTLDIENESINFGDVATVVYQSLDSSGTVQYTSDTYYAAIPPKVYLYVAETIQDAESMHLNGKYTIEVLNDSLSTYNIYAILESTNYADIILDNNVIGTNLVFSGGAVSHDVSYQGLTQSISQGSMQLLYSDVLNSFTDETAQKTTEFLFRFEWQGGYSSPLINNIPGVYNPIYLVRGNQVVQRPYSKETLTIAGVEFTLQGFSPILYNALTTYATAPNDTLSLYMGNGSFLMNTNYINNIAVQQEYTDGTTEEFIIDKTAITGGQAFGGMVGDTWDVVAYISKINSSKTLVHTKAWINYGSYWFNINNNSVDAPHFLLER